MQRFVKVDGKVRTDNTYPAGLMDVIDIDSTDEHFRLVYDAKGRFVAHRISKASAVWSHQCLSAELAAMRKTRRWAAHIHVHTRALSLGSRPDTHICRPVNSLHLQRSFRRSACA